MADAIRLRLPIPPSLNNAYWNVPGRGRIRSRGLADWKISAGWKLKAQRPGSVTGAYRFAIYLPEKMRGDLSNRIKAAEDLLVEHGVTPDDSRAVSVIAERSELVGDGECLVVVEAA